MPIVESYLHPGDYLTLTVSRQIPFSSDAYFSSDDINSLEIRVSCNGEEHYLISAGEGKYTDSTLIIKVGERYDLSFTYNSMNIYGYTTVPLKPTNFNESETSISVMRMDSTSTPTGGGGMWEMPEELTLTWDNDDGSFYIVVIENMEEILDPVRDFGDEEMPEGRFRKSPTTSSGLRLMPQEFQYFGRHRIILFHVLPDYASLYDETDASSLNLTNPSTSITNGYGIFTGLNADTLYLQVEEQK
ncbi:MAG: DUF4249 family protein [Bacteroidota bacterium]